MSFLRSLFGFLCLAFCVLSFSCGAFAADVAVISREGGYYASLGKHLVRWLKQESIEACFADKDSLGKALGSSKLAFLVGYNEVSDAEMDKISAFCARGGRLVVFYSAAPKLARLMGVKILGYKASSYPGQWSIMYFGGTYPSGAPKLIRQTSAVLQRAAPIKGKSRVLSSWYDRNGRSTGDAAWLVSSYGYWMTHVLLADGDEVEKARLLGAMVGSILPKAWSYAAYQKRKALQTATENAFAVRQKPKPGEIHAVWDHSGCGLYPGNWAKTMSVLKSSGVTDLFVNVAGAGFAHYPSSVLPRSRTCEQEGDQLKACLAAARNSGIRVHAWVLCFTATRSTKAWLDEFSRRGWRLKTRAGELSEYLDPSKAEVRNHLLAAIDELQVRYPQLAGIHLDFVRWYEKSVKPANASQVITRFVASAKRRVVRKRLFTVAVLGKYPACVASVGQDWAGWLSSNIVDYVVPMDYTESSTKFEEFLSQHASLGAAARKKVIVGIGVTANESRLSPMQVMRQILLARKYGLSGVALFDLDRQLETRVLPFLKQGLWRQPIAR